MTQDDADAEIDITREICPMTFVRTRLALDRLAPGQTLLVRLRGDEVRRNVPRNAVAQGHEVQWLSAEEGVERLLIRKGAGREGKARGFAPGPH